MPCMYLSDFYITFCCCYCEYVWNLCIEYNLPAILYTYIRKQSPQTIQKKPLYMKTVTKTFKLIFSFNINFRDFMVFRNKHYNYKFENVQMKTDNLWQTLNL